MSSRWPRCIDQLSNGRQYGWSVTPGGLDKRYAAGPSPSMGRFNGGIYGKELLQAHCRSKGSVKQLMCQETIVWAFLPNRYISQLSNSLASTTDDDTEICYARATSRRALCTGCKPSSSSSLLSYLVILHATWVRSRPCQTR